VLPSDEKLGKKRELVSMTQVRFGGETLREGSSQSGGERDHVFLSRAGAQFADVSFVSGADHPGDARSAAVWDYDRDGRPDLALANASAPLLAIFHNEIAPDEAPRVLALRFVGGNHVAEARSGVSARDAYGAQVTVALGEVTLSREHHAGEQLGGQNSATMLIGLGAHAKAAKVSVRFPSGKVRALADVPAGLLLTVYEDPAQSPTREAFVREPYARGIEAPAAADRRPVLALRDPEASAPRARITLYVTMATWCPACTREITQERALRAAFGAETLALLGVPIDETEGPALLATYVEEMRPAYRLLAGVTAEERAAVKRQVSAALRVDALPASIAVDPAGRVLATFRAVPSVSEIRALLDR
jgi:peroxiredoxin